MTVKKLTIGIVNASHFKKFQQQEKKSFVLKGQRSSSLGGFKRSL